MNETPTNKSGWRILRRILITLAIFATLIAIFYTEEDWRGKRAWEKCKRELEAKGVVLDWDKYIPPPVPDDQNFFKAPKMANWFVTSHRVGSPAFIAENKTNGLRQHLDATSPFDIAKSNSSNVTVVVAEIIFVSPKNSESALPLDDPTTGTQARQLIESSIGQSANGAQGLTLTARKLGQIQPVQIRLQADNIPSADGIGLLLGTDVVSKNLGNLRIETGVAGKSFRVLLVPHPYISAADYLAWSEQAGPDFDLIHEALKRPYAIIPGDYSRPEPIPIPNFVTMRALAQTLAQRAQCYLLLGQPDKALREMTLMHDVCRILERPPTGKPITLVEAMINVAITGLYVNTIADGFHFHAWQEPQLVALQEQLKGISLSRWVAESFQEEPVWATYLFESNPPRKLADMIHNVDPSGQPPTTWSLLKDPLYLYLEFAPRGWMYQSLVKLVSLEPRPAEGFDVEHGTISPRVFSEAAGNVDKFFAHPSPFKTLVRIGIPNFTRAAQTTAYNQSMADEAQIACALERYRLARGEYPETLDALVPQFIEKPPHDIIGGAPLHYRRPDDGKFLLYSIGWNEKDDGGQSSPSGENGWIDFTKGDWVWKN